MICFKLYKLHDILLYISVELFYLLCIYNEHNLTSIKIKLSTGEKIQTCEHKIFNPKTVAGKPIIIKNAPIAPPNSLDLVIPTRTFSGCSIILNSNGFLCSGANPYRRNVHMKYH